LVKTSEGKKQRVPWLQLGRARQGKKKVKGDVARMVAHREVVVVKTKETSGKLVCRKGGTF